MPSPVKVDQVKFTADKECEGKKITSLKNRECFGVKAIVTNCTQNTTESAMLLVLLYNENGECLKAEQSNVTMEPGEQKEVKVGMDVPADATYTAKAYIWRSLSDRTVWCLHNGI